MKSILSCFQSAFLLKLLNGSIVITVGVAGGIYLGYAIVSEKPLVNFEPDNYIEPTISEELTLYFGAGDLFPYEKYKELDGTLGNFEKLLKGKKSVVIFAAFG